MDRYRVGLREASRGQLSSLTRRVIADGIVVITKHRRDHIIAVPVTTIGISNLVRVVSEDAELRENPEFRYLVGQLARAMNLGGSDLVRAVSQDKDLRENPELRYLVGQLSRAMNLGGSECTTASLTTSDSCAEE